jgi:hypothetical protein
VQEDPEPLLTVPLKPALATSALDKVPAPLPATASKRTPAPASPSKQFRSEHLRSR